MSAQYRQSVQEVILHLSNLEFPSNIMGPFLQLLRHFDIGAVHDNRYCLLDSLLAGYLLALHTGRFVQCRHFDIGAVHDNRYCLLDSLLAGYLLALHTGRFVQCRHFPNTLKVQRMLFIRTKHSMQIFRVIPFIMLQNKT